MHACYPLSLSLSLSAGVLPLSHFIFSLSLSPLQPYDALERETPQSRKIHHQKRKKEKVTPLDSISGIWILEWLPFSSTFIILFSNHLILFNHFVVPLPLQGPPGPEIHVRFQFIFILTVTN
jgi:hypothetical protein